MFRRTSSADCSDCNQRAWQLHCPSVQCGWYTCTVCGLVFSPRREQSFVPESPGITSDGWGWDERKAS
jgi:hypothetical protein